MIHRAREVAGSPFGRKSSLLEPPDKPVQAATWFSHASKTSAQHRASLNDEAIFVLREEEASCSASRFVER